MDTAIPSATFRHGVHPQEHKEATECLPLERMPFVERYVLPLGQHIGAPSKAVVKAGDKVQRGQLIAAAGGYVSTCLHSPVKGKVTSIASRRNPNGQFVPAIEIEADPYSSQRLVEAPVGDLDSMSVADFVKAVQDAGLVGLGGAAFPSHVKYALPEGKRCQYLVLNGCECEPYLTCDHRVMAERAHDVVVGTGILQKKLNADRAVFGVEANKPDAIEALRREIPAGAAMEVKALYVKYPQGAEKMLIKAVFGREVPAGKLPLDLDMVVNNVATMAAIADYFVRGQPLIERVVTVSGPGIASPANLIVPIGTPVRQVLAHCGLSENTQQLIMGGPMMGQSLPSLDVPVLKGTSGLLAFTKDALLQRVEHPCIRCGRCIEACPVFLNPQQLARLSAHSEYQRAESDHYAMDCMECGACTFVCPSGIPIVQLIRVAKGVIRESKK